MAIPLTPDFEVCVGKSKSSQDFGFHFSAKLARTLAETLYDYKIEAVVREYSTNITDSHVDSGFPNKKGFVHVPTKLNPTIKFQDFGLGMDKDTIFKIYTVFGMSTKEHDNKTSGSLGYGSKSAFAVAEQFTVTSVKNKVKTVVICYKDKTGLPKADIKSETICEEENNTIVEIPVKLSQISEWQESCARVLGAFRNPHKVNTFGEHQHTFDIIKDVCKEARENGYVFIDNPKEVLKMHRSNTLALMGDILYHLPDSDKLIANTKLKSIVEKNVREGFYVVNFNIGDLDHAPSREAISYDKNTFRKVCRRVNSSVKHQYREFSKQVGDVDSTSFYLFYNKYKDTPIWDSVCEFKFPFTQGYVLKNVAPKYSGCWAYRNLMPLLDKNKFGDVKGIVRGAVYPHYHVFSSCVDTLNQSRICAIQSPIIVYSDSDKGLFKMKDTITTIHEKFNKSDVLYTNNKAQAENLAKWFGVSSDNIICGDVYSPNKTNNKIARKHTGWGVKEDWEAVCKHLAQGMSKFTTGKVDLKAENVYYTEEIVFLEDVEGFESNLHYTSTVIHKFVDILGCILVIKNKNNKGKIERANVGRFEDAISKYVKENKKELIKYSVWEWDSSTRLSTEQQIIANNIPNICKVMENLNKTWEAVCENTSIKNRKLCSVYPFKPEKLSGWNKEKSKKDKMIEKVEGKTQEVLDSLPLADMFYVHNKTGIEAFEYYLKLEKIIK